MNSVSTWLVPMISVGFVCSVAGLVIAILGEGRVTRNRSEVDD